MSDNLEKFGSGGRHIVIRFHWKSPLSAQFSSRLTSLIYLTRGRKLLTSIRWWPWSRERGYLLLSILRYNTFQSLQEVPNSQHDASQLLVRKTNGECKMCVNRAILSLSCFHFNSWCSNWVILAFLEHDDVMTSALNCNEIRIERWMLFFPLYV